MRSIEQPCTTAHSFLGLRALAGQLQDTSETIWSELSEEKGAQIEPPHREVRWGLVNLNPRVDSPRYSIVSVTVVECDSGPEVPVTEIV